MIRFTTGTLAIVSLVATTPRVEAVTTKIKPQQVVLVEGDKPAKVTQKDLIRIVATGIAGSTITAKIAGPGKFSGTAYVRTIKNGQRMLGTTVKEYMIKPSDSGTIAVTISVKSPMKADPKEFVYTIEVAE